MTVALIEENKRLVAAINLAQEHIGELERRCVNLRLADYSVGGSGQRVIFSLVDDPTIMKIARSGRVIIDWAQIAGDES